MGNTPTIIRAARLKRYKKEPCKNLDSISSPNEKVFQIEMRHIRQLFGRRSSPSKRSALPGLLVGRRGVSTSDFHLLRVPWPLKHFVPECLSKAFREPRL